MGEQIKLELLDILFGYRNNVLGRRAIDVVNNIILIGKMCISISKKTKSICTLFISFEQHVSIRNREPLESLWTEQNDVCKGVWCNIALYPV